MLYFRNDYSEGACPQVLKALADTNLIPTAGYGTDQFCAGAADTIRSLCEAPEAQVHFLVGGTQVNKTAIGAFLRPYGAVIAADTGHICVHETGAIEQNGHKILALPAQDGKLTAGLIRAAVERHCDEHMVLPRLVYISNTTEVGTVYSLSELTALSGCCRELGLLGVWDLRCCGAAVPSLKAALMKCWICWVLMSCCPMQIWWWSVKAAWTARAARARLRWEWPGEPNALSCR